MFSVDVVKPVEQSNQPTNMKRTEGRKQILVRLWSKGYTTVTRVNLYTIPGESDIEDIRLNRGLYRLICSVTLCLTREIIFCRSSPSLVMLASVHELKGKGHVPVESFGHTTSRSMYRLHNAFGVHFPFPHRFLASCHPSFLLLSVQGLP